MRGLIRQARWLFWDQAGWSRLSRGERWVAIYFALSLTAVGVLAEAPAPVLLAVAANFLNAARLVRRINLPAEEGVGGDADKPAGGAGL